jgi:hypothetical protein
MAAQGEVRGDPVVPAALPGSHLRMDQGTMVGDRQSLSLSARANWPLEDIG